MVLGVGPGDSGPRTESKRSGQKHSHSTSVYGSSLIIAISKTKNQKPTEDSSSNSRNPKSYGGMYKIDSEDTYKDHQQTSKYGYNQVAISRELSITRSHVSVNFTFQLRHHFLAFSPSACV